MLKSIFSAVVLALGVAFAGEALIEAQAQTPVGQAQAKPNIELSPGDQEFLQEAYERGLFEIGAAQLALENSSVFAVRFSSPVA